MAKYIYEGKHNINLLQYDYTLFDEGNNYYRLNFISKDGDRQVSL